MRVGLLAFACFDFGDDGLDQPGPLGVGEHGQPRVAGLHRFLVALVPVLDLLICAKHLFVAAIVAQDRLRPPTVNG